MNAPLTRSPGSRRSARRGKGNLLRVKPILARDADLLPSMYSTIGTLSIDLGNDCIRKHGSRSRIWKGLLSREIDNVDVGLIAVGRKGRCRVGGGCVMVGDWKRNLVRSHGWNRSRLGGSLIVGLLSGSDIAFVVATRGLGVRFQSSIQVSRTYRRLDHDLWLQLFSLHTRIVDLRSELSSLVALGFDQCACSRVQERIPFLHQALERRLKVELDPGDRMTGDDGASLV